MKLNLWTKTTPLAGIYLLALTACNAETAVTTPTNAMTTPTNAVTTPRIYTTGALLFAGSGTWSSEVAALEGILNDHSMTYRKVTSTQLDAMTSADLSDFGTFIFPGGNGSTEANSLSAATHQRLRDSVQKVGVGYVGFCAGAFIGQAPAPSNGGDVSYGLGIVEGPTLDYYALENQGITEAMTLLTFTDGTTQNVLWYGGPVTPEQGVFARYPDKTPAISEIQSGMGRVVLVGGHPAATLTMLGALGLQATSAEVQANQDLTWKLIQDAAGPSL